MHPQYPITLLTLAVHKFDDVVGARQRARQIAALLGFNIQDQTRIATAVSEIARNAYQYANGGTLRYEFKQQPLPTYSVIVSDKGPGIPSLSTMEGSQEPN